MEKHDILSQMCYIAENIDSFYFRCIPIINKTNCEIVCIKDVDYILKPFKPSCGDKLIFNKILDEIWDTLEKEILNAYSTRVVAFKIMMMWYYPYYAEWWYVPSRINELVDIHMRGKYC